MILLNPKQHTRPYADARSAAVMRATIGFFEAKGKDKLLADYYDRGECQTPVDCSGAGGTFTSPDRCCKPQGRSLS